jgi:hypothetical protein
VSNDEEWSPGGSRMYRHEARNREWSAPAQADDELIAAHIEREIGPVSGVFHEIVSEQVHLDVHVSPATDARPFHVLVTSGMSALPMTLPPGTDASPFAELMVLLPREWPLDDASWKNERFYWPVRWLKTLARLPHQYETWLSVGHTVPNGDPARPFHRSTGLAGMLVGPSLSLSPNTQQIDRPSGGRIDLWTLWPLHPNEMDLKLREGTDALADRFEAAGVSDVIDAARPSVLGPPARKKWLGIF